MVDPYAREKFYFTYICMHVCILTISFTAPGVTMEGKKEETKRHFSVPYPRTDWNTNWLA